MTQEIFDRMEIIRCQGRGLLHKQENFIAERTAVILEATAADMKPFQIAPLVGMWVRSVRKIIEREQAPS